MLHRGRRLADQPQGTEDPAFVRKVRGHVVLDADDRAGLARLCGPRRALYRGADLFDPRLGDDEALLVERGWAMRFTTLRGSRRQVFAFVLPGDVVGLRGLILGHPGEQVAALTPMTVSRVTLSGLEQAMRDHAGLYRAFLWSFAQDYALLCDRLTGFRRDAQERVARTLLELTLRWNLVRDPDAAAALPLTQTILGDALGLSAVHMNRTLKRLRASGLISERSPITVQDIAGLARVADLEPGDPLHRMFDAWQAP